MELEDLQREIEILRQSTDISDQLNEFKRELLQEQTFLKEQLKMELREEQTSLKNLILEGQTSLRMEILNEQTVLKNEILDGQANLKMEMLDEQMALKNEVLDGQTQLKQEILNGQTILKNEILEFTKQYNSKIIDIQQEILKYKQDMLQEIPQYFNHSNTHDFEKQAIIQNLEQLLQSKPISDTHKPSDVAMKIWKNDGYPDIIRLVAEEKMKINPNVGVTAQWQEAMVWGIKSKICGQIDTNKKPNGVIRMITPDGTIYDCEMDSKYRIQGFCRYIWGNGIHVIGWMKNTWWNGNWQCYNPDGTVDEEWSGWYEDDVKKRAIDPNDIKTYLGINFKKYLIQPKNNIEQ